MDKLYLVILGLIIPYLFVRFGLVYKTYREIRNSKKQPKNLLEFPVHKSTQDGYLDSKLKIESFLSAAAEKHKFNLSLDQNDLNNLFCKGLNIDKSVPGSYFYYSIKDTHIVEHCIQWPSWFTLSSVYTETSHISFENSKNYPNSAFEDSVGMPSANYTKIEEEGRELGILTRNYPINHLSLFVCIFDFGYLRLSRYVPNFESPEYKRAVMAMRNIDFIRIQNGNLIIQS